MKNKINDFCLSPINSFMKPNLLIKQVSLKMIFYLTFSHGTQRKTEFHKNQYNNVIHTFDKNLLHNVA